MILAFYLFFKGELMRFELAKSKKNPYKSIHIWESRDEELRQLRQQYAAKNNAWIAQKKRADALKKQLEKERKKLKEIMKMHDKQIGAVAKCLIFTIFTFVM